MIGNNVLFFICLLQEKFAYFDINQYGKFVLDRLDTVQKASQKKEKVTAFAEVMEDRQIHEVSRYFLATLQLVSFLNVLYCFCCIV